jgi:hypothetical protein
MFLPTKSRPRHECVLDENPGRGKKDANIGFAIVLAAILFPASAALATATLTLSGKILTGANAGSTDWRNPAATSIGDQFQVDIVASNDAQFFGAEIFVVADGIGSALTFDGGSTSAFWFSGALSKSGAPIEGLPNELVGISNGGDGSYVSYKLPRSLTNADLLPR